MAAPSDATERAVQAPGATKSADALDAIRSADALDATRSADALEATRIAEALDGETLWALLMDLAKIGGLQNGGVDRQALTAGDTEAKNFVIDWALARGLAAYQDEAANLFVRLEGEDPGADLVLVGSHLDTQPTGGKFDGALGVAAGLMTLDAYVRLGLRPRRAIEVVAFMNEEGCRFMPGALGSSIVAGAHRLDAFLGERTNDGTLVGEDLAASLAATRAEPRRMAALRPHAFVEAHIEQGPLLERAGIPVGVVTGVQGQRKFVVEIEGETAHAGTTPHAMRRDALHAAARFMTALHPLTQTEEDVLRLTFGRIEVLPNVPNTVPERARLTIDLRHPETAELDRVEAAIASAAASSAPCTARVRRVSSVAPVRFDEGVQRILAATADALAIPHIAMLSGAGHDAMHMAAICPSAMVFIPCRNGLSHHVEEWAEPAAVTRGARVVAGAVATLAGSL